MAKRNRMPGAWWTCGVLALALAGCQTSVPLHAIKQPLFALGQAPVGATPVEAAGAARPGALGELTVSIRGALAGLRQRSVLATVAEVERVTVTVEVGGTSVSQSVNRDALSAGQTSVTFSGLPVGTASVVILAYGVGDQVLGTTSKQVAIAAGAVTTTDLVLQLAPTTSAPGGGGSSPTTGGLSANVTILDSPVLMKTLPSDTVSHALNMEPNAVAVDAAGNAWVAGMEPIELNGVPMMEGRLVKLSPTGEQLLERTYPSTVWSIAIDGAGHVWVATDHEQAVDNGVLRELDADGNLLGSWSIAPGAKRIVPGPDGVLRLANQFMGRLATFDRATGVETWAAENEGAGFSVAARAGGGYATSGGDLAWFAADGSSAGTVALAGFNPGPIAVDAAGNCWAIGQDAGNGLKIVSPAGEVFASLPEVDAHMVVPSMPRLQRIAFDAAGGGWVLNDDELVQVTPTGLLAGSYALGTGCHGLAAGSSGLWIIDNQRRVRQIRP